MSTLWIDVTSFIRWTRPPVGIIRVEQELIKWAISNLETVRFFEYDDLSREFRSIDQPEVLSSIAHQSAGRATPATGSPVVINNAHWLIRPRSSEIKRIIRDLARAYYRFFLIFINAAYHPRIHRLKTIFSSSQKTLLVHPFKENDRIFCAGTTWEYASINDAINLIKKSVKLSYYGFCHDLAPIKFPHLCVVDGDHFSAYLSALSRSADHLFCISQSTENDYKCFLQAMKIASPTTSIVTEGSEIYQGEICLSQPLKSLIDSQYILFVSTMERRKNHECIYKSILYLLENGYENLPKFVFVGMRGWGLNDLFSDFHLNPQIKDRILILSEISDGELSALYRHTLFTVYPSFYEGWGLPIAESLNYGKMAIVSSTSSMPEVGGDLVDYVHPYDIIGWANRIGFYLDNRDELAHRENRIRERYQMNSWHNFCEQVFQHLKELPQCK